MEESKEEARGSRKDRAPPKDGEEEKAGEEEDSKKEKKKNWTNPFKMYKAYRAQKRLEKETMLFQREEQMNQDLERYLMGIEEHRCWVAFQLGHINFERMKKKAILNRAAKKEEKKQAVLEEEWGKENGLQYFLGSIQSFKRWQNSPAKYIDFKGHQGAVTSCRLSPCMQYLLSCSEDKTLKVWNTETGECIKTLSGHSKVVNDADFHVDFKMFHRYPCIVSASGDCTLRIWNSSDTRAILTLYGHEHAVYRVAFAPDGRSIVSCSEDRTVRTWCFPEGYNLFVYRGHTSGVTSVRFSSSGRFFASGSDYGERKLLLWNAKMPQMKEPVQFPHIFFWTPEGLIKKVVIRKTIPSPNFWLMQTQLHWLNDDDMDLWPGEISDIEDGNDEDEDTDGEADGLDDDMDSFGGSSKGKDTNEFNADDVRELKGVSLRVIRVGSGGDQSEATEYNPGGFLVVSIRSSEDTFSEAFFDAMSKSSRYDIFLSSSGQRLGQFDLDAPVPWLPMKKIIDPKGRVKYFRDPPPGTRMSRNQKSAIFRESAIKISYMQHHTLSKSPAGEDPTASEEGEVDYTRRLDLVWTCPQEENMGVVVIVANVKMKNSPEWLQFRYTVKESPIRVNAVGEVKVREVGAKRAITFDQEERHRQFWKHIRDKDYQAAAGFIDRRAIAHTERGSIYRRFRILNLMVSIFDEAPWLILHSPYIFRQGVTKSVVLCETSFDEGISNNNNDEPLGEPDQEEETPEPSPPTQRLELEARADASDQDDFSGRPNDDRPLSQQGSERGEASGGDFDATPEADDPSVEVVDGPVASSRIMSSEAAPLSHDMVMALRNRPTTRSRPVQVIWWKTNKPRTLDRQVELMAETATQALIEAEGGSLECGHEMGLRLQQRLLLQLLHQRAVEEERSRTASDVQIANDLLMLHDSCDLLAYQSNSLADELFELQQKSVWKRERKGIGAVSGVTSVLSSDMIKTGKYGPDIEEYSMTLPKFFPSRAGQAKYALRPAIARFESQLSRLEAERLPSTLAEVYVPTLRERAGVVYHLLNHTDQKVYRENIKSRMRLEARRQVLEDSVYLGARRPSYTSLPGLAAHYPNPNYPVPAVVPPENEFAAPQQAPETFADRLFGRPVVRSANSAPVGRKPARLSGSTFAQWTLRVQKTMEKCTMGAHKFAFDKVEYEADVLGNLLSADATTKTEKAKGFWGGMRARRKKSSPSAQALKAMLLPDVLKDGYPRGFYAGRRGTYPLAPGLLDFMEMQKLSVAPAMEDTQQVVGDDKPVEGLVRRFKFNGFELAHHGSVNDLVFAPSETRLVTAGGDGLLKIWDPRDGSFVRGLNGHVGEIRSVQYSSNEQFLVSCGADMKIIIWSMLTQSIQRVLKGHVDIVNAVSITSDCSVIFSASHDLTLKSWYTTPRAPATPAPPRVVSVTHNSAMISWTAPPSFNLDLTAFHIQFRVGLRERWRPLKSTSTVVSGPEEVEEEVEEGEEVRLVSTRGAPDAERVGLCVAPHLRARTMTHLIPATYYQFRVRAENRMGLSDWSQPSSLTRTDFGLPEAPERPLVVRTGVDFIQLLWFTPNPETYGSASTSFDVEYSGHGHEFHIEDDEVAPTGKPKPKPDQTPANLLELALEDAAINGKIVQRAFEQIHERFLQTKDKLRKSEVFGMHTRQTADEEHEFSVSKELNSEVIFQVLERCKDHTHLPVSAVVRGLQPGYLYMFRSRGVNRVGCGEWSVPTLTISTMATLPAVPARPFLADSSLRSLTFQWAPPADGGTAITGYMIHLLNTDKYLELGRSTVTYTWDGLFPGRSYRVRVRAVNSIGASDFSEPNLEEDSHTRTAPPEQPTPCPLAVAGTWSELRYEVVAPYSNGAPIESMVIQFRLITPFSVGNWELPFGHPVYTVRHLLYRPDEPHAASKLALLRASTARSLSTVGSKSSDSSLDGGDEAIEVVDFVDTHKQQEALEQTVRDLELLKNSSGFNPYKADKGKLEQEIEALIHRQKPGGSRLRFRLLNLLSDSMYETRVAFINSAGQGPFSESSHRAKTNKASPPGACGLPVVASLGAKFMVLEVTVPFEGGAPVRYFQIECMDLDDSSVLKLRLSRNALDQEKVVHHRIENLRPGGSYIVRCCAESSVGPGPYSPWTKEVELVPAGASASYIVPQKK